MKFLFTIGAFFLSSYLFTVNAQTGNTGIGTINPEYRLHVIDTGAAAKRNTLFGVLTALPPTTVITSATIYGTSTTGIGLLGVSESQSGIYGLTSGGYGGVTGVNSGGGYGVWGVSTGSGAGGFFDGGSGARGIIVNNGASGFGTTTPFGRLHVVQPATPVPAVDTFAAIMAYSYTAQGCLKGALQGEYNTSNYGTGIQGIGYNGINNQQANAVFALGNQDLGVYGSANTAGVQGVSVNGIGVAGYNKNAFFAATTGGGNSYGVYGYANTIGGAAVPTARYGVYGFATGAATNYAGYFSGNVQVTGSIAKGSGTFKIDHPLDPANKYLYHSFVESPDMMNIYNGNVTTDAQGKAVVTLPSYFEAENKDFKYQLTIIDETQFVQVRIAKKITGNTFVIMTDKPNIEVSWEVTGVRQDKFANAHRVVPEVEKEKEFKGYYLHAKEWGLPDEKSIDYLTRPNKATLQKDKLAADDKNITKPGAAKTTSSAKDNTPSSTTAGGAEIKTIK
ncbi:hypothetical protein [Ferruginibacter sp. HRS2-29]|uniref:hypothetical protein n=1 Tax=Ferruginibacter sp. HRS2-29 TaxID=2487334 RepID=UPI0020CF1E16|nr:hypothetical protein [Ferruginibacter sp. HRS2-29]MCP9752284.1 hypothetical protein [Ferruginibacter sp. HRS2-29]